MTKKDRMASNSLEEDIRGFKVVGVTEIQGFKNIKDEISVTTPNNGVFKVKDFILVSVENTSYEKIFNDLKNSGIEIIEKSILEDGIVNIQIILDEELKSSNY